MRIVVTRPLPGAQRTANRLAAAGHDVLLAPMIEVRMLSPALPAADFQALLLTSANAAHAAGLLCKSRGTENSAAHAVFAVGERTAEAAREAGFTDIHVPSTPGGADVLAAFVARHVKPGGGALLYVSGRDTTGDLDAQLERRGYTVNRVIGYAAEQATRFPEAVAESLAQDRVDAVLFYSARTAQAFFRAASDQTAALARAKTRFLCLSPAIAAMLPDEIPAERVLVAESPDESALLACIERIRCQGSGCTGDNNRADADARRPSGQRGQDG
ncbi:MAG: uroporphyrinogen-III synthase [Rhodobiaceae bacterium]|nr:uroporphyrinogen-III synthase [Rhodobiaceae bacterium]MCC0041219.1 uroporphyrinogen-III synthase [Rhodobiaceae bacterium]